jgi:nucleosome binding factor SPN SPT16 subunit
MQEKNEPKLSDIMLSLPEVKEQVTTLRKRIDQISPTSTEIIFDQSHGTKAFERAMENLDIDSDDIQDLPKRNPRRSTIYENSMKFREPLVNESNIQMLFSPIQSDLLLTHLTVSAVLFFMDKFRVLQQKQRNISLLVGDLFHLSVSEELVAREIDDNDNDYSDKVIGTILRLENVYSLRDDCKGNHTP